MCRANGPSSASAISTATAKPTILWRATSGNVAIWEMNGTSVLNPNTSFVGNVPTPQWSIVGTGDFNADAKGDLLWQDTSGNVAIWEMNGTAVLNQNSSFVAKVASQWSIKGTGDFNGTARPTSCGRTRRVM